MKKRLLYLILPVITLVLEILPYGAVCNFANPDGGPWRQTFSYFDLTPFGYANFAPFLTALATCLIFVLLVVYCVNGKVAIAGATKKLLVVAGLLPLGPLLLGISYYSLEAGLITLSLIGELLFLQFAVKNSTE